MKPRTKKGIVLITALTITPFLLSYILAVETQQTNAFYHSLIIYSVFFAAGFSASVIACIISFGIKPFKINK